ncbi:MAG: DnaA/Hda family protein [Candidatus Eisenbacteria bacterium]|nr:DnaA/Hda family protein [Candidatus Eisenbacteria bacterium]
MIPSSAPSTTRVLVASGDLRLRKLMRIALDEVGGPPIEATDGMTLIREAFASHPDIIVMQRELPDQDGLQVLARLKQELQRPPVIVVTRGTDADARLVCFAAEADDVVSIPFDARELKARVEAVVRRSRSRTPGIRNTFAETHLIQLAGNVFDTFVEGRSNRAAVEAAREVAERPGKRFNPLFIYGPPGVGKTHLLGSIGHHLASTAPDLTLLYVSATEFSNEYLTAIASGETELFWSKYGHADALLLDDLQYLGGGNLVEDTARLVREMAEHGRQVVASSDRTLEELRPAIKELGSVLEKGLVAKIDLPDREHRFRILQTQAVINKWNLPDAMLNLIADVVASDARSLQGAARKLVAIRTIQGGVLTTESARYALRDLAQGEEVVTDAAFRVTSSSAALRPLESGSYELGEAEERPPQPSRRATDGPPREWKPPTESTPDPASITPRGPSPLDTRPTRRAQPPTPAPVDAEDGEDDSPRHHWYDRLRGK